MAQVLLIERRAHSAQWKEKTQFASRPPPPPEIEEKILIALHLQRFFTRNHNDDAVLLGSKFRTGGKTFRSGKFFGSFVSSVPN